MEKADELFEKYAKELELDTQVDVTNLRDKLESLAHNRSKWMYRWRQCEKNLYRLKSAENEYIEQSVNSSPIELSKAKISKKVETDPNYKKLVDEIHDYETLIAYLEENNKILKDMGYSMTNLVELLKFEG